MAAAPVPHQHTHGCMKFCSGSSVTTIIIHQGEPSGASGLSREIDALAKEVAVYLARKAADARSRAFVGAPARTTLTPGAPEHRRRLRRVLQP